MQILRFLLVATVTLFTGSLFAQSVLISWDVSGQNSGASSTLAGSVGSHIASGTLSLGSGVTTSSTASTFGGSSFDQTSLSSAISGNDYISFTITPAAGYSVSISSLTYNAGQSGSSTSFNSVLTSSATGFTVADAIDSYNFSSTTPSARTVSITSSSLQNITGTTEFRLYGWISSGASTDTFRIRNLNGADLVINGTVSAVPEPVESIALCGVLAFAIAAINRRRVTRQNIAA